MDSLGVLIFDMDGTLVDSMEQHAAIFSQILYEEYGIPLSISREIYLNTAGKPLDQQFLLVLGSYADTHRVDVNRLIERFWILVQESEPVLFPDVLESIKQLKHAGYLLAVTSGCATNVVNAKMTKSGISQYFNIMLGTDYNTPGARKGEEHFRIIRDFLNLSQEEFRSNSAFVGDSVYDMQIAKEAGILAIGRVTEKNIDELSRAGAKFVIYTLYELISLLEYPDPRLKHFIPISFLQGGRGVK